MILSRRNFLKGATLVLSNPELVLASPKEIKGGLEKLASLEYENISHSPITWEELQDGLNFARVDVYRDKELVDKIVVVKLDSTKNKIRIFNNYKSPTEVGLLTIEEWQRLTSASVVFNSAQYLPRPTYGAPIALIITDGKKRGPVYNKSSRGMLVAEPTNKTLPLADLLDFEYDKFDHRTTSYAQGVQHWPILLDKQGKIKVKPSNWQANRTVVAKNRDGNMLVFVTEGGFFTLYNFGRFLKESSFNVHTAMNLDGGYEASMCIKTPKLHYVTYGQFETQGPYKDISIPRIKIAIPGAIGIFPRR